MNAYIKDWLADQLEDSSFEFPDDFDAISATAQLADWFDYSVLDDHLDHLLTELLKKLNT